MFICSAKKTNQFMLVGTCKVKKRIMVMIIMTVIIVIT